MTLIISSESADRASEVFHQAEEFAHQAAHPRLTYRLATPEPAPVSPIEFALQIASLFIRWSRLIYSS